MVCQPVANHHSLGVAMQTVKLSTYSGKVGKNRKSYRNLNFRVENDYAFFPNVIEIASSIVIARITSRFQMHNI